MVGAHGAYLLHEPREVVEQRIHSEPLQLAMGFVRFFILVTLLQFMAALPIKMVLRWTINLKYIVYSPEYFFNI